MNQPQKNNSQTTDIRQKHINAIRQRLKQKREEYCKTRSDKNILCLLYTSDAADD